MITTDMWLAILILGTAIVLFVTEWLRVDVVALGVVIALMLSGLLTTQEAISGFASPAVLTIASLFVVGGAVLQTGLAGAIGQRILRIAGSKPGPLTAVIMGTVALLSGFMSDTGTVAVLLPAISSLSVSAQVSASRLLIPLAYGALLGGATTLIGTPPNIIVSDLLRTEGLQPFGFFSFTPIGVILLIAGVLYILLVARRWLPEYSVKQDIQRVETPEELVALYRLPDNLYRLRIRRRSDLVGKTLAEANLRQSFSASVLEIHRPQEIKSAAKIGSTQLQIQADGHEILAPQPDLTLHAGDILITQGGATDIGHLAATWNLAVQPAEAQDESALLSNEVGLVEVLIPPRSALVGKTLVEARIGSIYHLTVLGVHRPGVSEPLALKTTPLSFGDTLLVQGSWENIRQIQKQRRDFVVLGNPDDMTAAPLRKRAPFALLVLAGMLVLMITNLVSVTAASMLAALGMILTGCLTIDDAYEAVDWKSIVLVAGMLPMSIALESVGLVNLIAQGLTDSLGRFGPLAVLAGLFILTSTFTQLLSNTATTVLIAPIGLVSAHKLGVNPYAFLMAIAIAASMAFATPVASPVNTLVMGAGHYRFSDYLRIGVPLIFIMLVVSLIMLPILWPF